MKGAPLAIAGVLAAAGLLGSVLSSRPDAHPVASVQTERARAPASGTSVGPLGERFAQLRGSQAGLLALLTAEAERHPAEAVQLAATLRDSEGRLEALRECLPLWLKADPEAARNWLLASVAGLPVELAQLLARTAAAHDPELGLSVAQQMHIGARPRAVKDVFTEWAGSQPAEAARRAALLDRADGQIPVLAEVAGIWAESDPRSAFRWAEQLEGADQRRETMTPIIERWAARDPAEAAAYAASIPEAPWRQRVLDQVAGQWVTREPDRALGWARALPESEAREAATSTVLAGMMSAQPARAAELALSLSSPQSVLVEKLLTSWIARDPSAALGWAETRPEAARGQLVALSLSRWREQDQAAAALWAETHQAGREE